MREGFTPVMVLVNDDTRKTDGLMRPPVLDVPNGVLGMYGLWSGPNAVMYKRKWLSRGLRRIRIGVKMD